MLLAQFVLLVGFVVWFLATGADVGDKVDALSDTDHVTPSQLAYLNLSLAAAIPVALLLTRVLHGLRPGWVASVIGRLRWRWMLVSLRAGVRGAARHGGGRRRSSRRPATRPTPPAG